MWRQVECVGERCLLRSPLDMGGCPYAMMLMEESMTYRQQRQAQRKAQLDFARFIDEFLKDMDTEEETYVEQPCDTSQTTGSD